MAGSHEQTKFVAVTVTQPDSGHIITTYYGGKDADKVSQIDVIVTDKVYLRHKQWGSQEFHLSNRLKVPLPLTVIFQEMIMLSRLGNSWTVPVRYSLIQLSRIR